MYGPSTGSNGADPIANYRTDELLISGQWYVMGEFQSDHRKFIGHSINKNEFDTLMKIYNRHLELLGNLPK